LKYEEDTKIDFLLFVRLFYLIYLQTYGKSHLEEDNKSEISGFSDKIVNNLTDDMEVVEIDSEENESEYNQDTF
jgi:hypothetical protein